MPKTSQTGAVSATSINGEVKGKLATKHKFIQIVKAWSDRPQAAYGELEHADEAQLQSLMASTRTKFSRAKEVISFGRACSESCPAIFT